MDKPERVEIGHWWQFDGEPPMRICAQQTQAQYWFETSDGRVLCDAALVFNERYMYLGSSEHPEPSEWMIETLARHYLDVRGCVTNESVVEQARRSVVRIARNDPPIPDMTYPDRAAASLYRILRDLGRW